MWAVAAGIVDVAWIESQENLEDAFIKRLSEVTRDKIFGNWAY